MDLYEVFLLVAAVLCAVGGAIRVGNRSWDGALVAFGIACLSLAFIDLF